jgi:hypothetical protein
MRSVPSSPTNPPIAVALREAFERLKRGKPERLPKGTPITQNNVAREAERDPSALKKSRYPGLIREIQHWAEQQPSEASPSSRQAILATRKRNRSLREKIEALMTERDLAMSLLVEADAKILDLILENARLNALLRPANVAPMPNRDNER